MRSRTPSKAGSAPPRLGLTLIELVIVLIVLVALAGLVVPTVTGTVSDSRTQATQASMVEIRTVILSRYLPEVASPALLPRPGTAGLSNGRSDHPQMRYLFVNPADETSTVQFDPHSHLGWRGPYLAYSTGTYTVVGTFTADHGVTGDPTLVDAWGRPIVFDFVATSGTAADSDDPADFALRSAGSDGNLDTDDDIILRLRGEGN